MPPEATTCVLASGNAGKLAELSNTLTQHRIRLIAQSEYNVSDVAETGITFLENALIKARHASAATGLPAMADDSGLVVPALNGQPGIYSARYAGTPDSDKKPTDDENIDKLLSELQPLPSQARDAYFVCVLAYLQHPADPLPVIATGYWRGRILDERQGTDGFGYDPVFYCPGEKMTAAQMGKSRKRQISHRALALQELSERLAKLH
ncbi:non-canonical purine NTP pyrophosphatase, RdgB/HAM1 family [Chromatiales bacterium (ex Bugula neritina AB1)]|nr:non-canonical purine NTP pyrophosphatase, RdgB/HAM1 family [Chromatiales bacterium (ex Bugula neritina AB1)]